MRRGILFGAGAYITWGLFPLYWPLLKPAGPMEILAHRIIWSLVAVIAILAVTRHWAWIKTLRPKRVALLAVAAVIITVNWGTYIYAVNNGHTIEAALGYFINPLVSVLLGVLVFRERLRAWQWAAIGISVAAVVILAADYGRLPWIALILACSFGTYGLAKKFANTGSAESLTIETTALFVPALAYTFFQPHQTFTGHGASHVALLVGAGVVTAVPLMMFNSAATRVPLTVIGMLQYLAPILQFSIGLLVQHEAMPASRWVGFLLVWGALIILTVDGLRAVRSNRRRGAPLPEPVAEAA
ncbi:MAG: RarD protein superfamily transporter [Actinoallomurus sp.]|jgi:chloramphenicol-sensitive protein RarD|nr:RarD protein superfamily transporter [Actinoallomurus sp.]